MEASFIEALSTDDLKEFLCDNYKITFVSINYRVDDEEMAFSGCELLESDVATEYVLHHYFKPEDKIE